MLLTSPERLGFVIDAVASSVKLPAEDIQKLIDLRNGDPMLKDITDPLAFVEAVSKPYTVPVDLPRIPKESVTADDVWLALNQSRDAKGIPSGAKVEAYAKKFQALIDAGQDPDYTKPEIQVLDACWQLWQAKNSGYKSIDLTKDSVKAYQTLLIGAGLLTQEEAESLLTLPNPVTEELMSSKLDQTLGVASGVLALEEAVQVMA